MRQELPAIRVDSIAVNPSSRQRSQFDVYELLTSRLGGKGGGELKK